MGMQEELTKVVRLIESVDGKEGMALEKMHMLSQAGLFIRTHHAEIQRNAEDAARYRWLRERMDHSDVGNFENIGIDGDVILNDGIDLAIDAAMHSANDEEAA